MILRNRQKNPSKACSNWSPQQQQQSHAVSSLTELVSDRSRGLEPSATPGARDSGVRLRPGLMESSGLISSVRMGLGPAPTLVLEPEPETDQEPEEPDPDPEPEPEPEEPEPEPEPEPAPWAPLLGPLPGPSVMPWVGEWRGLRGRVLAARGGSGVSPGGVLVSSRSMPTQNASASTQGGTTARSPRPPESGAP